MTGIGRAAALAAAVLAMGVACDATAQPGADKAWVQAVPGGRELRLVTAEDACPAVSVDGERRSPRIRARRDSAFAATICALSLQPSDRTIEAAGARITLPPPAPNRIVVLGDTGCRVNGKKVQACNDLKAWPFETVAKLAAARHPDLIIHVGDYLYRERACTNGGATCQAWPHGDAWPTWAADFFTPAGPLLTAAPWVFVRGNHESCARAGLGWFRLLDAAPAPQACPSDSAPFSVDLGAQSLIVLDSAETDDRDIKHDKAFSQEFEAGLELAPKGRPLWIATHRPVWAVAPAAKLGPLGQLEVGLNRSEQVALHGEDLRRVDLFLSGHIHEFESLVFGPGRPPQLVVGTGGDVAEDGAVATIQNKTVSLDGMDAQLLQFARFGYLVLDRTKDGWSGGFYDTADRLTVSCRTAGRRLDCVPVK